MAHSLSAKKRIRQNAKHAARNRWRMRSMKVVIKDLVDKLAHGSADDVAKAHGAFVKIVDRTAAKGVIHKNQAARRKSRMSVRVKAKLGTAKK
jgi:small subunit ribosomal protein S20